jgi:hypothetical protein
MEYSKAQLLHILEVTKSMNAHKTLLEKLLKRKKSLVVSFKKAAPRSFFVPYRDAVPVPELLPLDPADDPLTVAEQLLQGWTLPLPPRKGSVTYCPPKAVRVPKKATPMKVLDAFTQSLRAQPEVPLPLRSINWDNVGGFKKDFDATMGTLTVCTMNVNGLTEPKLDMVIQLMQKEAISVCILTDTKIQKSQMDFYGKKARAVLGGGTRVHCSMLRKAGRNKQNFSFHLPLLFAVRFVTFLMTFSWLICLDRNQVRNGQF